MTLTITMPLPPKELSPNGRSHWRAKAKAVKSYRKRAAEEAMVSVYEQNQDWTPLEDPHIQVTYYHKTSNFRDPDNILACLKSAIDGLVDGGIMTDDCDVTYYPVKRLKDSERPRVELKVSRTEIS